jgi:hypothetical protein
MATFVTTDRVEVRSTGSAAWRAGEVTATDARKGNAYEVTLDTPLNANAWSGRTRKYGGSNFLSVVTISKSSETLQPGQFIKAEGT